MPAERPQATGNREAAETPKAKAHRIYQTLLSFNEQAFVFETGEVTVGDIEVSIWQPQQTNYTLLQDRGLREEEFTRGVINLKSGNLHSGRFKQVVLTPEDKLRFVNVQRGFGRTLRDRYLQHEERKALETAIPLSAAPLEIAQTFGSYGQWIDLLDDVDTALLGTTSSSSLYVNGLETLVAEMSRLAGTDRIKAQIAQNFLPHIRKAMPRKTS